MQENSELSEWYDLRDEVLVTANSGGASHIGVILAYYFNKNIASRFDVPLIEFNGEIYV